MVTPPPASAAVTLTPSASAGVLYYSNLFNLAGGDRPLVPGAPDVRGGDTSEQYGVGLAGVFKQSDTDNIDFHVNGKHIDYERFGYLDHNEIEAGAALKWRLGPVLDFSAEYSFVRAMANFADTLSTQLELNTTKGGSATLGVHITPEWRLDLTPRYTEMDTPLPSIAALPAFPDFRLIEKQGEVAINYLGLARVTTGLAVRYSQGTYDGIAAATKYDQVVANVIATYKVSGLSSFNGALGFTTRDTKENVAGSVDTGLGGQANPYFAGDIGRTSTVTGRIGYARQISVKTSFTALLFREVDSYVAGANAVVGTGVELGANWSPDFRFTFMGEVNIQRQQFVGTVLAENFADRSDDVYAGQFRVIYRATPWLNVSAHVNYDSRSSNFSQANYSSWIVGLDVTGQVTTH